MPSPIVNVRDEDHGRAHIQFHVIIRMGDLRTVLTDFYPTFLIRWNNLASHIKGHFLDVPNPPNPIIAATLGSISGSSSVIFSFWDMLSTIRCCKREMKSHKVLQFSLITNLLLLLFLSTLTLSFLLFLLLLQDPFIKICKLEQENNMNLHSSTTLYKTLEVITLLNPKQMIFTHLKLSTLLCKAWSIFPLFENLKPLLDLRAKQKQKK